MFWTRITAKKLEKSTDEQIDRLLSNYVEKILYKPRPESQIYAAIQNIKPKIRAYYASGILDFEVKNGGFSQFLFNTSRYLIYDARYCYEMIGWQKHVHLIEQVIKKINPNQLKPELLMEHLDSRRNEALSEYMKGNEAAFHESTAKLSKELDVARFDDKYYKLVEKSEIFPALIQHVRTNYTDFTT